MVMGKCTLCARHMPAPISSQIADLRLQVVRWECVYSLCAVRQANATLSAGLILGFACSA
eukprot:scaffold322156_cov35-Tisochrysis_lutea.AAC.2